MSGTSAGGPGAAEASIRILVDADACPVKDEIYKVAARHGLPTTIVANSYLNVPRDPLIERVVVGSRLDEADDWIAERARRGVIVVTADVPLAARCVKAGAAVIAPTGRAFTEDGIGMALATRDLMDGLRSAGQHTSGPPPFSQRDRSAFLSALDLAVVRLKRAGWAEGRSAPLLGDGHGKKRGGSMSVTGSKRRRRRFSFLPSQSLGGTAQRAQQANLHQ